VIWNTNRRGDYMDFNERNIKQMTFKRGDIFYARIPKLEDSHIQTGVRPVIITSNERALKYSPVIQYIPITTKLNKTKLPVHVNLDTDFLKPSIALVEQEGCIDKTRLMEKVGRLSEKDMRKIDIAILEQRGIDPKKLNYIA
jgi:mRNA interferase MazF